MTKLEREIWGKGKKTNRKKEKKRKPINQSDSGIQQRFGIKRRYHRYRAGLKGEKSERGNLGLRRDSY